MDGTGGYKTLQNTLDYKVTLLRFAPRPIFLSAHPSFVNSFSRSFACPRAMRVRCGWHHTRLTRRLYGNLSRNAVSLQYTLLLYLISALEVVYFSDLADTCALWVGAHAPTARAVRPRAEQHARSTHGYGPMSYDTPQASDAAGGSGCEATSRSSTLAIPEKVSFCRCKGSSALCSVAM